MREDADLVCVWNGTIDAGMDWPVEYHTQSTLVRGRDHEWSWRSVKRPRPRRCGPKVPLMEIQGLFIDPFRQV